MTTNLLNSIVVYVLSFIDSHGFKQDALVCPVAVADGVILDETAPGSGILWGNLLTGGRIEIPFTHYLGAEVARVSINNGNGTSGHTMSDQQVGNMLNNAPRDEDGEVKPSPNVERIRASDGDTIYEKPAKR
jgi:hypothetical protein